MDGWVGLIDQCGWMHGGGWDWMLVVIIDVVVDVDVDVDVRDDDLIYDMAS